MSKIKSFLSNLLNMFRKKPAWYELGIVVGLIKLLKIRNKLREENLYDTENPPLAKHLNPNEIPAEKVKYRTFDGTFNDLNFPKMGAAGARFGRNFPLDKVRPDIPNLMNPSPRLVSRKLMTRNIFQPVEILNLMAASWLQFQVHDWFVHKEGQPEDSHDIPLEDDDDWNGSMRIPRTPAETPKKGTPTYANLNSHWWDSSQIYGTNTEIAKKLRTLSDGKMKTGDNGLLPLDANGEELTGFSDNWWIGLSMLHALFVAEHNAICDHLKLKFKDQNWSDERLFQQARLVNAALMAKIHTVEWTPGILPHRTTATALRANWAGLAGEELQEVIKVLNESDILGGIVGTEPDHHGVPYSLTEEFVAVYRMHPLMPDEFTFTVLDTGKKIGTYQLPDVSLNKTRGIMEKVRLADLFYSFGISHPGAIRLHNYPRHLQRLTKKDGSIIDLASIDILRDRERGVPRYNDFREMLRMDRITKFEDLTDEKTWVQEIKEVYDGNINHVDLMVGLLAEPLIDGFGFSETAFRIFSLMASRRLQSDRFLTSSYTEEIYTKPGLDWIKDNSMVTVLLRHHKSLEGALRGVENAFGPWNNLHPEK